MVENKAVVCVDEQTVSSASDTPGWIRKIGGVKVLAGYATMLVGIGTGIAGLVGAGDNIIVAGGVMVVLGQAILSFTRAITESAYITANANTTLTTKAVTANSTAAIDRVLGTSEGK